MKTPKRNSQARIFGIDFLACEENQRLVQAAPSLSTHLHKNVVPLYTEDHSSVATSVSNYGFSPCYVDEIRPPLPCDQDTVKQLVLSNHKLMYEEALNMKTHNEMDLWLKEKRIKALEDLNQNSSEQYSSTSSLSSYESDSSGRMSEDKFEPSSCQPVNTELVPSRCAQMMSNSRIGFFDSHCHLDVLFQISKFNGTYADFIARHKNTYPESYKGCIAVFCKPLTFAKVSMWKQHLQHENVWGAFGCHPKNAKEYNSKIEKDLVSALNHPKVKALGEIGLDYSDRNTSSISKQHQVFRRQLQIAYSRKLPVVIHCREAEEDTIRILHEVLPKTYMFHLHCFTGNWESAQRWMKEFPSVFIGITNLVTFPSATPTHEVAKKLPCDRLLLETDAPYFVPRVFPKGKGPSCSHPGMAIHVATRIAKLKNMPVGDILKYTEANTKLVYRLP